MSRITGTLHEDQYTFMVTSRSVFLILRNVSYESCGENNNTHFTSSNFFFFEIRAVYEIIWKSFVDLGRPQITIWRMRIACWITKATNKLRICNTYRFELFHCNNDYANAPQCYIIRTLFLFSVTLGGKYSNHWALRV